MSFHLPRCLGVLGLLATAPGTPEDLGEWSLEQLKFELPSKALGALVSRGGSAGDCRSRAGERTFVLDEENTVCSYDGAHVMVGRCRGLLVVCVLRCVMVSREAGDTDGYCVLGVRFRYTVCIRSLYMYIAL